MLHKEQKKHYLLKIIIAVVITFFVVMAFVEPKPEVKTVEKPFKTSQEVQ